MNPEKRIAEFDFIRVVSLTCILLCHSCFIISSVTEPLGRYLGSTFNFLFLVLSAFLIGGAWNKKGRPAYSFKFLTKRLGKLTRSYYPYLATLFVFLYISQDYFSVRNILTHILYLPWFDKIDGFGHLWFLTMIVVCYIGCWTVTRFSGIHMRTGNILNYSILTGGYFA